MAQSFISQVIAQEKRYIGDVLIYEGPSTSISFPSSFNFNIQIPNEAPIPEIDKINLQVLGVAGSDPDGTVYSGQFKIRRNPSSGIPSVRVVGDLTDTQISVIKNSISITESDSSLNSISDISLSLKPIARVGAKNFSVILPYDDDSITSPNNNITIPFLSFDASNRNSSYSNPIIVTVDNNELSIDAGSLPREGPILTLEKNYPTSRKIDYLIANYNPSVDTGIDFSWSESLSYSQGSNIIRQEGIRISPNSIPSLPQTDGTITTDLNYNVFISSHFWKTNSSAPTNVHRDTSETGRFAYNIQYGIGRVINNSLLGGRLFDFGVYAGSSSSVIIDNLLNILYLRINVNDSGSAAKRPFALTNKHSSPFSRINLNIDRSNSNNNSFVVEGYINGAPTTFTYNSFSNNTTIQDFISQIESALASQYPIWYNNPSSNQRGLVFTLDSKYKYGQVGDLQSVEILNVNPNQSINNSFILVPVNSGLNFNKSMTLYSNSSGLNASLQEIYNWIISNFGSYGLVFNWYIPDIPEWRSLKFVPLIYGPVASSSRPMFSQGSLTLAGFNSDPACYFSINKESSKGQEVNSNGSDAINSIAISLGSSVTVSDVAQILETKLNDIIERNFVSYLGSPSIFTVSCTVPNEYYKSLNANNYLYFISTMSTYPFFTNPASFGSYTRYQKPLSDRSSGNILNGTFSKSNLFGTITGTFVIPISPLDTLGDLVDLINSSSSTDRYDYFIKARLVDDTYGNEFQNNISFINSWDVVQSGTLYINAEINTSIIKRYSFSRYRSLSSLVSAINLDWLNNIEVFIDSAIDLHSDAIPSKLISPISQDITNDPLPKIFNGVVNSVSSIIVPSSDVKLDFFIAFAQDVTNGGSNQPNSYGIQVAIGGYEKGGVFFANKAPNNFFEPVYNSVFPISFSTIDADVIYLLVRSRQGSDSPQYSSFPSHYSGIIKYSNQYNPTNIVPYIPTDSSFINAWDEGSLGVPTVIAVPVFSTVMDVTIEDSFILDSINLQLINKPSEINEFGFLAINRTNNNNSQKESKIAKTFGLVLDNRSSWDILISPEAKLTLDDSGSLSHLGSFYSREVFDDDEGFDFTIISDLPQEVKQSVSISPLAGNPQIWVLRIEFGVKRYLAKLIEETNDRESLVGCSVDIDLLVKGRSTGVEGTARVSIYYDFKCVYDIGLCDFFWNLIDPPKPTSPEIIQNRLSFNYQTLVDCSNSISDSNENIVLKAPVLVTISNIPTFRNGNALLVIKSSYTPEIQGFYFPTSNEIDPLQFADCSSVNENLPLIQRLNKEFLFLPNQQNPVTDVSEIRYLLENSESYLWVKPQFQFPVNDLIQDCNSNEIVIAGIGYRFKNWTNGLRQDDIIIGLNLLFSQGVYTSPEINFCYRYYYNQKEG